jgi:hypothetical protein
LPLLKYFSTKWFCNLWRVWTYGQSELTLMLPLVGDVCDWMTIGFSLVIIHVLTTQVNISFYFIFISSTFPFLFFFLVFFQI